MQLRRLYRLRLPLRCFLLAPGRASAIHLAARHAADLIQDSRGHVLVEHIAHPDQLAEHLHGAVPIGGWTRTSALLLAQTAQSRGEESEPEPGPEVRAAFADAYAANLTALPDGPDDAPEATPGQKIYRFRVELDVLALARDHHEAVEQLLASAYEEILAETTPVRIERILSVEQLLGEEHDARPLGAAFTVLSCAKREESMALVD